ncbi:MAG TPA: zinc ribbon domain-containing protein [Pseudonocardiaceae bacterium]|jgi:hypothetical protein|nr:zinc ribbon domain-containing protein [Pseudonocardiaceae bacterium]
MLLIWGYRRTVQQLAMLMLVCRSCGNPAAHTLKRLVTKFTLFFIPLFPIGSGKYYTQCTFCGTTNQLDKQQATQLQEQQQQFNAGTAGNPPPQSGAFPAQQYPAQQQQIQQYPAQQYPAQQYPGQQPPQSGPFPAQQPQPAQQQFGGQQQFGAQPYGNQQAPGQQYPGGFPTPPRN